MRIRFGILLTGLSVFAQLYLFQPILDRLSHHFAILPATASLSVSTGTVGMAIGLFLFVFHADRIDRKRLMAVSLLVSSLLTALAGLASSFTLLLTLCLLRGIALSGVSAVALAYLAEEMPSGGIGLAIALYLSGNTIGGMFGRVAATLLTGAYGWRVAVVTIGLATLLLALLFVALTPRSRHFTPTNIPYRTRFRRMGCFLSTPYFLALYGAAFLFMGSFVSLYNYLSFLLEAPPFSFPHRVVAAVYLMYIVGVVGSLLFGRLSDRYPSQRLLLIALTLSVLGLGALAIKTLPTLIVGLGLFTAAFFAAHTVASRMVSTRAAAGKSSATCLYWLFYYLGSSSAGYLTGLVLFAYGWGAFIFALVAMQLVAFALASRYLSPRYVPGPDFHVPA